MDKGWLDQCSAATLPVPPFDREVHILPNHVLKRRLVQGELGYDGYEPDIATLAMRDENELRAMELVRQHTTIPVPRLIHRGDGFNVFERFHGVTVNEHSIWTKVSARQRESLKLQVRGYIQQLARIPNPTGGIRSLVGSGEVVHHQLPHRGPFASTAAFLHAYADEDAPYLRQIAPDSNPVFSHMDWDLSNVILSPTLDAVVGVVDWERAAFFPEGGRSIHRMCHQWDGWEQLFDGLEFPRVRSRE